MKTPRKCLNCVTVILHSAIDQINVWINHSNHFAYFNAVICLSSWAACDLSSSSFSFFYCSRLLMRALHFHLSFSFCSYSVCCFCLSTRDALYAVFADLTLATICGVNGIFFTSIPASWIASNTTFKATTVFSSMLTFASSLVLTIHLPQLHSHVIIQVRAGSLTITLCLSYCYVIPKCSITSTLKGRVMKNLSWLHIFSDLSLTLC